VTTTTKTKKKTVQGDFKMNDTHHMSRMSRVISFHTKAAPGWLLQYNMDDHHFTMTRWTPRARFGRTLGRWLLIGASKVPTIAEIEKEAERVLHDAAIVWQDHLEADGVDWSGPDFFTDILSP
jgi:transcription initiation factor TFIIIB Brf1 subunit/transcription initiation factor TFIIB